MHGGRLLSCALSSEATHPELIVNFLQAAFQRADRDGGGSLDLEEFLGAFGKVWSLVAHGWL